MKYQDEIHGSLIEQVDNTVDLIYTKYLKALISYDGIQRVEQLFMKHSSKPYNPKLANIFFKSGMIEARGRGFEKNQRSL